MIFTLIYRLSLVFLFVNVFPVTSDEEYDESRGPGSKTVAISGERGQCMVLVFTDGYLHQCFDRPQVSRFDLKSLKSFALLLLYEVNTGKIIDMSKIPSGYDETNAVNTPSSTNNTTTDSSGDGSKVKQSIQTKTHFELLWPKVGEVVSTAHIDFR